MSEGTLTVTEDGDLVWLDLGGTTCRAGMTPEQADQAAAMLLSRANAVRMKKRRKHGT